MIGGNDISVRATLTDGTNPYVISALNDYELYVYYKEGSVKKLIGTYKKSNAGLYGITVYDDANGIVDIVINRELTKTIANDTKIYLETRVRITASSPFISSLQNLGANEVYIDTVYSSASPNSLT